VKSLGRRLLSGGNRLNNAPLLMPSIGSIKKG
jgi:hypothetical protein